MKERDCKIERERKILRVIREISLEFFSETAWLAIAALTHPAGLDSVVVLVLEREKRKEGERFKERETDSETERERERLKEI